MDSNLTMPVIGSNGAISEILGAYIIKFPKLKIDSILPLIVVFIPIEGPAFFYLFWWFIQQWFYGIGTLNIPSGVTHLGFWGQLSGLVTGAAFMKMIERR